MTGSVKIRPWPDGRVADVPVAHEDECGHEAEICMTPECLASWGADHVLYLRQSPAGQAFIERMGLDDEVVVHLATKQPTDAESVEAAFGRDFKGIK